MTFQAREPERAERREGWPLELLLRDLALAATAAAVCLVLGSNLFDAARANDELRKITKDQAARITTAGRPEAQLDALAKGVQELAAAGNPNAQKIVAVLQANGIRIKPGG